MVGELSAAEYVRSRSQSALLFGDQFQVQSYRALGRKAFHRTQESIQRLRSKKKGEPQSTQESTLTAPTPRLPLTPPLSGNTTQEAFGQSQSPFFKLPFELREEIYKQVVGRSNIHITHAVTLRHLRCKCPSCPGYMSYWDYGFSWKRTWACDESKYDYDSDSLSIALLLSCRKVYAEAIGLLYSSNTFTFQNQNIFRGFLYALPPSGRVCLRSIHMDLPSSALDRDVPESSCFFHSDAFDLLINLPDLRFLEFRVHFPPKERSDTYVADFRALDRLRRMPNLQLVRFYIPVQSESPAWVHEKPFETLPLYTWALWERYSLPKSAFVF